MAYGDGTAGSAAGSRAAGWLAGRIAALTAMLRRRRVYRRTVQELHALSTRELADLGIPRSMITRIALEAARNAD